MHLLKIVFSAFCISSLLLMGIPYPVAASKGTPNTATFGYGAEIDPLGSHTDSAILLAKQIHLDWVKVPLDWAHVQADVHTTPDWSGMDAIIHEAAKNKISILIQLKNPPNWAQTEHGPDAKHSADFVEAIVDRFWPSVQAVEIFPGANRNNSWGTTPDAAAYIHLLGTVKDRLLEKECPVFLVAGGLSVFQTDQPHNGIDPEIFLSQMYQAGLANVSDLISIQIEENLQQGLEDITAESSPIQILNQMHQIMLENGHTNGRLWITHMKLPSGTITEYEQWLIHICSQIRSHLFVGTLFIGTIDPENRVIPGFEENPETWLRSDHQINPFSSIMKELIDMNNGGKGSVGT